MKGTVMAITNQKGGVGKTTTTVNLGIGLARQGKKVLLIDADPQGSMTVSLGVKRPDELDITTSTILQDSINDEINNLDKGVIHHKEGVDFLPANIELSSTELQMISTISREYALKGYTDKMKEKYDYILIDCMPSLGVMTINSLVAADSVIIPSQPNYLSTKGLDLLLRSIARIKRQINPNLQIGGILLTMVDKRTNNARAIISSLRTSMSALKVFETEIPFSVKAAESSLEGKSIYSHDKNGKLAQAYMSFVKEVEENERGSKDRFRTDRVR